MDLQMEGKSQNTIKIKKDKKYLKYGGINIDNHRNDLAHIKE